MEALVFKGNEGQSLTNSLLVADKFGKRHVEVLDAIRDLKSKAENSTFVKNQIVVDMFVVIEQEIPMPERGILQPALAEGDGVRVVRDQENHHQQAGRYGAGHDHDQGYGERASVFHE